MTSVDIALGIVGAVIILITLWFVVSAVWFVCWGFRVAARDVKASAAHREQARKTDERY